jgi:hypothetical protein
MQQQSRSGSCRVSIPLVVSAALLFISSAVVEMLALVELSSTAENIAMRRTESSAHLQGVHADPNLVFLERTDCAIIAPCATGNRSLYKTTCYSIYPQRFWRSAIAESFAPALHWQRIHRPKTVYENEFLQWRRLANVTVQGGDADEDTCVNNRLPETLVYWHNFKAGGTTARATLADAEGGIPHYETERIQFGENNPYKEFDKLLESSFALTQELYRRQQHQPDSVVAFSFVRSPVIRFLSGLAQISRMPLETETTRGNRPCFGLKDPNRKVQCVLRDIERTGVFFNVHLYPQAYLLDTWTGWGLLDMRITLASMHDMDAILTAVSGGRPVVKERASNVGNRQDKILVTELAKSTVARICKVYAVDILLLQLLNMPDPLCSANSQPIESTVSLPTVVDVV